MKAQKQFLLTFEQEKIVKPLLKQAHKDFAKGRPGLVLAQIRGADPAGDLNACVVYIEKEYADKFTRLINKYEKYLEAKK